jgi:D-alanyl-lipoteichoic acid acyltransferase DltB (MBOAT superfamily)
LWHGAAWTFVVWGGLHGLYVVAEAASKQARGKLVSRLRLDRRPALLAVLSGLITFILVDLAWIFFRANSIADAFLLLTNLTPLTNLADLNAPWATVVDNPAQEMALSLILILLLLVVHWVQERPWPTTFVWPRPLWFRWAAYLGLALAIMNLGITEEVPFIYFQF